MNSVVSAEKQGRILTLLVDSPPVNALSQAVRQGIAEGLAAALADAEVDAVVLACRGRTFIAGADITEFGKPPRDPALGDVIAALDASPKPVVAAIHGTALGGGLEVALACHYRVAVGTAKVGLPEVKLGILPGAGGTQRLPRVVGVERALDMIVGGEPIGAVEARKLGLLDELVEGDLLPGAVAFAARVAAARPLPRVRDREAVLSSPPGGAGPFDAARKAYLARSRGGRAGLRCIEAVEAATRLPFDEGIALERRLITEAIGSTESRALRHAFFAERAAAKVPDLPEGMKGRAVRRAAVLGAGTMGAGIAMVLANAGIETLLVDREAALVERGIEQISRNYGATVKKGKLSAAEMEARVGRITGTTSWDGLAGVDLVIEAVFEEMSLKKEIFGRLAAVCARDAILATNTSTLDVNEIAAATGRPGQVIGLHFFSPANVMRLLEIVRGKETSLEVVATAMALARQLGKVGVLVGVCYGFVGNRMLHQYYREAHFLIQEGALPEQVDRVMTEFGFAMGPCATSDLAGIDVGWRIRKAQPKPPPGARYFGAVPDRLAELGRYGQKTSAGFYRYEAGDRTPRPDPEVERIILEVSRELGIERRAVTDEEILERCLLALINEGARILGEGIALRASDIDTVWLHGYGFPAHRGGPMFHADGIGARSLVERLRALAATHGATLWAPAPILERLASESGTFAGLDAALAKGGA